MSIFRSLVLVGCWLGLSPALVQATSIEAHPCFACDDAAFRTTAADRGVGRHYIYDFHSGQIKAFDVSRELDLVPGAIVFLAMETLVPAGHRAYFDTLVQVRQELGSLSMITVPVTVGPTDPVGGLTAYDVVSSSGARNSISEWLRTQANEIFARAGLPSNTASNLASLLQSLDKIFTQGELLRVQVEITLFDGSSVVYEFSKDNAVEGRPEYISDSARDVNLQSVLVPGQTLPNGTRFDFGNDNSADEINRWLNHMCSIVPCVRPGDPGRVTGCVIVDGQVTCTSF